MDIFLDSPIQLEKSREALFSDSSPFAAGKRRDFCRLPHASFSVAGPTRCWLEATAEGAVYSRPHCAAVEHCSRARVGSFYRLSDLAAAPAAHSLPATREPVRTFVSIGRKYC